MRLDSRRGHPLSIAARITVSGHVFRPQRSPGGRWRDRERGDAPIDARRPPGVYSRSTAAVRCTRVAATSPS